jgi:serine phosphatase RsbU (regulator of sigma subunit)
MALLTVINDRGYTEQYQLRGRECVLGRQSDTDLRLDARDVSRRHARILSEGTDFFLEDLGSSNGTYLNNTRIAGRQPLHEQDRIQIGPFTICFQLDEEIQDEQIKITATVPAVVSNTKLFRLDAARKLQVVLEIAQQLSRTLDLKSLLPQLMERLLALFLQADRGMVVLLDERGRPEVRAVRTRYADQDIPRGFSRSVIKRVLEEGVGVVAEDAKDDHRFAATQTLTGLGVRSFVCAPLKAHDNRPLGVIVLDRFGQGNSFKEDDLQLLTACALLTATVIENAALHEELVEKARMDRDLSLARQVQEGFLPRRLPEPLTDRLELCAEVYPAREVAGDFYDFFPLGANRLGFAVADISGKGVSAAMLMSGIRTLCRHLLTPAQVLDSDAEIADEPATALTNPYQGGNGKGGDAYPALDTKGAPFQCGGAGLSPAQTLQQLNDLLAQDNPHALFVTMVLGVIDAKTGQVTISGGGHPPVFVRRRDTRVERVLQPAGRLLGVVASPQQFMDTTMELAPGDTLLLYTDGLTETYDQQRQAMFGLDRLMTALHALPAQSTLEQWEQHLKKNIESFSGRTDCDDDMTIFLLRRK